MTAAALLAETDANLTAGDDLSALIGIGQLLQAVADAEFEVRGSDARSPATDALMAAMMQLSASSSGEEHHRAAMVEGAPRPTDGPESAPSRAVPAGPPALPTGSGLAAQLGPALPTAPLEVRLPEGYAFYALHPALYAAAARRLPPADWRVIGVRSIGTSLAASVAAALGAPPPVTVRPTGHPFARELRLSPDLEAEWAAHPGPFVIVDEGPGLSGSSFGAVADALERLGVARERIAFLPGHDGDLGPQAAPEHRARWSAAVRPTASFEHVVLPRLQAGVEGLVGPAVQPVRDLSGGLWRVGRLDRPPVFAAQERRKFLHETADGRWLVKFAGLGRIGRAKLDRARALHQTGFTPEPAGLVDGFLVERWIEGARPVTPPIGRIAAYLSVRKGLGAEPEAGADLPALAEMVRVNVGEALGPQAGDAAAGRIRIHVEHRPAYVDGRLHRWEWVRDSDGRIRKTDALDHSEAHDLVGAQDITWDIAGAELELDLSKAETEHLRTALGADPDLLASMQLAYPAFQLGLWTMAAQSQAAWGDEGARAQAHADRYARRLATLLDVDPSPRRG